MRALLVAALVTACSAPAAETSILDAAVAAAPYTAGAVFPNLQLEGFVDRNGDRTLAPEEFGPFRVADVVASAPDYLLVHVAFGWCEWCWIEAKQQMTWLDGYGGKLRALQVYVDDLRGERADRGDLQFWVTQNKSFVPAGLEREDTLLAKFGKNATYLLVDVKRSMTIVAVGAGPPAFEKIRKLLVEKLGPLPT